MQNIHQELDALDSVCESKTELVTYHLPRLAKIVETIQLLPRAEQEEYFSRLERISMILEGQILTLSEELEELRKKIPLAQVNSTAARAYNRTIAIIPVKKPKPSAT